MSTALAVLLTLVAWCLVLSVAPAESSTAQRAPSASASPSTSTEGAAPAPDTSAPPSTVAETASGTEADDEQTGVLASDVVLPAGARDGAAAAVPEPAAPALAGAPLTVPD